MSTTPTRFPFLRRRGPNEYLVTFANGAYTPPSDVPPAGGTGGAQTNGVVTDPVYPISEDGSDAAGVAGAICSDYAATLRNAFDYAGGFYCVMSEASARTMSHDSRVACVESNARVYSAAVYQNPGWALDRIDQHPALRPGGGPPNDQFTYSGFAPGVDAWVVDSGIHVSGPEFTNVQGQVQYEFPNASGQPDGTCVSLHRSDSSTPYTSADDDSGHGTSVASLIGGRDHGVVPQVGLRAVKVTDDNGKGYLSSLLAGLNYVRGHLSTKRAVVNMSLVFLPGDNTGLGNYSPSDQTMLTNILSGLASANVVLVADAGNNHMDAGATNTLPAAYSTTIPGFLTVGATKLNSNSSDAIDLSYSNYGSAVSLFAPEPQCRSPSTILRRKPRRTESVPALPSRLPWSRAWSLNGYRNFPATLRAKSSRPSLARRPWGS